MKKKGGKRLIIREIDCVILVDGGTDSLMRGDEVELGTPTEDMSSIAAIHQLKVPFLSFFSPFDFVFFLLPF